MILILIMLAFWKYLCTHPLHVRLHACMFLLCWT